MHWFFSEMFRFIAMGGYGWYVWPAYLIAFIILSINIYLPWRTRRELMKQLEL